MRVKQRDYTRGKMVKAALSATTEMGLNAIGPRAITLRAKACQGLLAYTVTTKDAPWRAAASLSFAVQKETIAGIAKVGRAGRRPMRFNTKRPGIISVYNDPRLQR